MQPIHDVDVLLLLALALSSKRRPAELVEIVAATEIVQGVIPADVRLVEAFSRLARHGLIRAQDGGFTLTAEAQNVLANPSRSADTTKRIAGIKEKLAAYNAQGEHAPIQLTTKEVCVAILAHRASANSAAKNLLAPKPQTSASDKPRPGQRQRKPLPARRRKD
ncbi:hypothetical protein [Propionivibrio limicola]|uniref:hypothetical protein n=1 Tax=Propionivibrio limicola TaxID=167645 RepID=UPI0012920D64|nr:hypothetical protein [Propionivibrio limicola]